MASTPALAEPITITAKPIASFERANPERTEFGALTFRGGLELRGSDRSFGGYSGLRVEADGSRFRALSDRATWLEGRIVYDGTRPIGIEDASIAEVLDAKGASLVGTSRGDTEALEVRGSTAWVTTEGVPQLLRFDFGANNANPRGFLTIRLPKGMTAMPSNAGLEALAIVPDGQPRAGSFLMLGEDPSGKDGNHPAWLIPGKGGFAETLSLREHDGFAVTDATFLPGGDLVVLQRKYRAPLLSIRIRRIAAKDVAPGAVLDGPLLFEANLSQEIDNLEAISATKAADGTTVLTLLSDDNFNPFQRTILLQFGLKE
ncbi:esterase-like activity of phytase family protein [Flaviflagellibacter deserti]|uniref:Esterase-like activity of phytase family protein n=1 Tax=Flaviflagellibacter deserti TaxID=2267266 RepID=A0ABV9Z4C8_9HYPH